MKRLSYTPVCVGPSVHRPTECLAVSPLSQPQLSNNEAVICCDDHSVLLMFLNLIPMVMHWIFYTNIKSGIKVRMQNKKTEIKSCVLVAIVCSVTAKIYANPYSYINKRLSIVKVGWCQKRVWSPGSSAILGSVEHFSVFQLIVLVFKSIYTPCQAPNDRQSRKISNLALCANKEQLLPLKR